MSTILYGIGKWACCGKSIRQSIASLIEKYKPVCWCDIDSAKWETTIAGIPVMSFEQATVLYPDFNVIITVDPLTTKKKIQDYLIDEKNVRQERIVNYETYRNGLFCKNLLFTLVFSIHNALEYCCPAPGSMPSPMAKFDGSCNDAAEQFLNYREKILNALANGEDNACSGCPFLQEGVYPTSATQRKYTDQKK